MKKTIKLIAVLALLLVTQSCTKKKLKNALVHKDCTGTYINFNSKSFLVCNQESLDNFNHGDQVNVKFQEIEECDAPRFVCHLYPTPTIAGTIEILDVH